MPQTPWTATGPYISNAQFLDFYAQPIVADLLRFNPSSPPPSYLAICDTTNPAGQRLYRHLQEGAGEIEAACGIAKRYSYLDLQALTGVSQVLLQKLNAARGMWCLSQYLKPMSARPDDVPMAKESAELLKFLRDGEMIFSYLETQDAGLSSVVEAQPDRLLTPNVVGYANRLFPNYQANGLVNRPGRRGGGS